MTLIKMAEADIERGVQLYPWGTVKHPKGDFTVDEGFAADMLEAFEAFTADGYYPPVLLEHRPDGSTYGVVKSLEVRAGEGIFGDVEFAAGIKARVDRGLHRNVSPSHYTTFKHPHTGKEYAHVLRELSLVSVPHFKNLQPLGEHYAMSEAGFVTPITHDQEATMADEKQAPEAPVANEEQDEQKPEEGGDLTALTERVAALEKSMSDMLSMMEGKPAEDEPTDNAEQPTADDRIAALERQLAISEAKVAISARLPKAKPEQVASLATLTVDNAEHAEVAIEMAEQGMRAGGTQAPIGVLSGASGHGPGSLDEAFEMSEKALGTSDLAVIAPYVCEKWPHLAGELGG